MKHITKEKRHGIVVNKHGGDRKSGKFKKEQECGTKISFVSLDALSTELPEEPLPWGTKTSVPNYDNYDYPESGNDRTTDKWLRKGDI